MIEIPVHNAEGKQVDTVKVDPALLGDEVRHVLLKQAYVRYHANQRQGSAATKGRGDVEGSTRKLFRQKGTGGARRGNVRTNLLRGGGVAFAKKPKSWRQGMPTKMRRLATRNALLAKMVGDDNQPLAKPEIKLIDKFDFSKPSTKQFQGILSSLEINRTCLVALGDTRGFEARSASNIDDVTVRPIRNLNAFDLLNHRFVLTDKASFVSYLDEAKAWAGKDVVEVESVVAGQEA